MQDIHSSIHIPIKHKAAVRAVVHPLGQRFQGNGGVALQFVEDMAVDFVQFVHDGDPNEK